MSVVKICCGKQSREDQHVRRRSLHSSFGFSVKHMKVASFSARFDEVDARLLRKVIKAIGAHVVEGELPVGLAHDAFADDGSLANPNLRAALAALVERLLGEVRTRVAQPA